MKLRTVATLALALLLVASASLALAQVESEIIIEGPDERGTAVESDGFVSGNGSTETLTFAYDQVDPQIEFTGFESINAFGNQTDTTSISGGTDVTHHGDRTAVFSGSQILIYEDGSQIDSYDTGVNEPQYLEFSPDGNYIAYQGQSLGVYEVNGANVYSTGSLYTLEHQNLYSWKLFDWGPDGNLALPIDDDEVGIVDNSTWSSSSVLDTDELVAGVRYSPDGERFAVMDSTADNLDPVLKVANISESLADSYGWVGSEQDGAVFHPRWVGNDQIMGIPDTQGSTFTTVDVSGTNIVDTQSRSISHTLPRFTDLYSTGEYIFSAGSGPSIIRISPSDWTSTKHADQGFLSYDGDTLLTYDGSTAYKWEDESLVTSDPWIDVTGNGVWDASYAGDLAEGESVTVDIETELLAGERDFTVHAGGSEEVEWQYTGYNDGRAHVDTLALNGHEYTVDQRVNNTSIVLQNDISQNGNTLNLTTGSSSEGDRIDLKIRADGFGQYDDVEITKTAQGLDERHEEYELTDESLIISNVTQEASWSFDLVTDTESTPPGDEGGMPVDGDDPPISDRLPDVVPDFIGDVLDSIWNTASNIAQSLKGLLPF